MKNFYFSILYESLMMPLCYLIYGKKKMLKTILLILIGALIHIAYLNARDTFEDEVVINGTSSIEQRLTALTNRIATLEEENRQLKTGAIKLDDRRHTRNKS